MGRLFGTDGVRGIANRDLTCDFSLNLGIATAVVLGKKKDNIKLSSLVVLIIPWKEALSERLEDTLIIFCLPGVASK